MCISWFPRFPRTYLISNPSQRCFANVIFLSRSGRVYGHLVTLSIFVSCQCGTVNSFRYHWHRAWIYGVQHGVNLPDAMPIPRGMMCERKFSHATCTAPTGPTPVARPWGIFEEAFVDHKAAPYLNNDTFEEHDARPRTHRNIPGKARGSADVPSSSSTQSETGEEEDGEI